jgi:hypothetical protein
MELAPHPPPPCRRASRPPAPWASLRPLLFPCFLCLKLYPGCFTPHALGSSSSSPHHHPCRSLFLGVPLARAVTLSFCQIVGATLCSLHPLRAGILYLAPAGLLRGSLRSPWWLLRRCAPTLTVALPTPHMALGALLRAPPPRIRSRPSVVPDNGGGTSGQKAIKTAAGTGTRVPRIRRPVCLNLVATRTPTAIKSENGL